MATDAWDPAQYEKFREQRLQPFFDLCAWIRFRPTMRIIDLGCGTGELAAELAARTPSGTVLGIDSSVAMLAQAAKHRSERVTFQHMGIERVDDCSGYDLVFSNAALHWVPDNERVVSQILRQLKPGAQIAVQLPRNGHHPSHRAAEEVAREPPFRDRLRGFAAQNEALPLERYAELLFEHRFREQFAVEKIYGHELRDSSAVVEWVKGTLLTSYFARLDEHERSAFLDRYRERLLGEIGDRAPYYYTYRRLLFWGQKSI